MTEIKQKIAGAQYDFLRNNADLWDCIYLVVSGSYGYDTNNDASDIDLRDVLIEHLYGLQSYEQLEDHPTDTVIYGVRKFVSLCIAANPNALELLGVDEDCIVLMTGAGHVLRENTSLFLSQIATLKSS